jgi:hypothetical protein
MNSGIAPAGLTSAGEPRSTKIDFVKSAKLLLKGWQTLTGPTGSGIDYMVPRVRESDRPGHFATPDVYR